MYQFEGITVSIEKRSLFACTAENTKWDKLLHSIRVSILGGTMLTSDFEQSDIETTYAA